MLLTAQQNQGIAFICDRISTEPVIALEGPAGSGKTTMMKKLVEELKALNHQVVVAAMTNKAAKVLNDKGIAAMTLHQACLRPRFKPPLDKVSRLLEKALTTELNHEIDIPRDLLRQYDVDSLHKAFEQVRSSGICTALRGLGIRDIFKYLAGWDPMEHQSGILLVDETSMMGGTDLVSACKVFDHVVLIGDPFQLPPVKSEAVFWTVPVRYALTEIHRQAKGAQPLELATALRTGGGVVPKPIVKVNHEDAAQGVPVIVWRNQTRIDIVEAIRRRLGLGGMPPQPGETLVCRNGSDRAAKDRGLINNSIWTVMESNDYRCTLQNERGEVLDDEPVYIEELDQGEGVPFRFGYALTAHNAQGSEWDRVMIHVQDARGCMRMNREDGTKWLYTAITRAKSEVIWVSGA